ncbi:MAG: alpha/beta fold hydrolase [Candidatus Eremiobacteraeota bacterium]|nr:alpha/beta fold hydrolase [Candidatus Eremiobacteraeota bacterium]
MVTVTLSYYHGITPYKIVMQHRKMSVLHFVSERRLRKPVLCVPALISRSYVLDLTEGASTVRALCDAGYDVFLIDWGVVSDEDANLSLQDVLASIDRAADAVRTQSGSRNLTLLGYCMGGTLALMWAAWRRLGRKNNLVLLAAPFDAKNGGTLAHWCQDRFVDIDRVVATFGNVPANVVEALFTLLRPTAKMRAAIGFTGTYEDPASVRSFSAMDRWANDWVAFPGQAAKEWIAWIYRENRLRDGTLELHGTRLDVRNVKAATLIVAAPGDAIVPAESSRALAEAIGSRDVTTIDVKGGHIGMVASAKTARDLFTALLLWLRPRSE